MSGITVRRELVEVELARCATALTYAIVLDVNQFMSLFIPMLTRGKILVSLSSKHEVDKVIHTAIILLSILVRTRVPVFLPTLQSLSTNLH